MSPTGSKTPGPSGDRGHGARSAVAALHHAGHAGAAFPAGVLAWHIGPRGAVLHMNRLPPDSARLAVAMLDLLRSAEVTAEGRIVRVGGRRVHVLVCGAGPPLLLLHGAGGGCANWYGVLPALSRHYRVIAPDLPGFGFSDRIPAVFPLGVAAADWTAALMEHLHLPACPVVGTSFGGLVALRLAERSPEFASKVVVIDSVGLGQELPWQVRIAALRILAPLLSRGGGRSSAKVFKHLLVSNAGRIPPAQRAALVDYLGASDRAGASGTVARTLHLFAGPRGQREVIGANVLRRIDVPVLVVWGNEDDFLPLSHAHDAAEHLPKGQVRRVENAGHSPNWEAPDALLDEMLPFLDRREVSD